MKLCSYILTSDSGYAPNPYGGICTLAHCTPVELRARLEPGDWLMGTTGAYREHRLIYAMRIVEVMTRAEYMADPRFRGSSKPRAPRDDKPAFLSTHFYYFGASAPLIPVVCERLIYRGRGIKYCFYEAVIDAFQRWLSGFPVGIQDEPLDPGREWLII